MAISRTLEFLPDFLKTTANKKFLAATLDQLTSEPSVRRFNGYIGRQFTPIYQPDDRYIVEPTTQRQNYQLEPGVVVDNEGKTEFFSAYTDLIQQIEFNGGLVNNHSRLFSNQAYTYNPHIDLDKLVNFGNYYWLPNGPDVVPVGIQAISGNKDYIFKINSNKNVYNIDDITSSNPDIVLRRGGTYRFVVNQPGQKFYIQTEPGVNGTSKRNNKISTREITGLTNNGDDVGTLLFVVPSKTAQNSVSLVPTITEIDFAVTKRFRDIDNKLLSQIKDIDGFVGDLQNRYVVFVEQTASPVSWTSTQAVDGNGNNVTGYPGKTIQAVNRSGIFQIKLIDVPGDKLITLNLLAPTPEDTKLFIKYGESQAGLEYYRPTGNNYLQKYPVISADLDILYYQNSANPNMVGRIKIVDNVSQINVEQEIIGKVDYTAPNGVIFENGLKIQFDSQVLPDKYKNKTYIVEGVGRGISLIEYKNISVANIDYITIAKDSIDYNDWSTTNRWTHERVIRNTAKYNQSTAIFDQNHRAKRPIIEFEKNLQLYNHGREFVDEVDFIDMSLTDAFGDENTTNFAGRTNLSYQGETLVTGQRIIFAKDANLSIRHNIYKINIVSLADTQGTPVNTVILTLEKEILNFQNVKVTKGLDSTKGKNFYINDNEWIQGQQKTATNQLPLFDVVDENFNSLSSLASSNFRGTRLFGYKVGIGNNDTILNFPLSYKSINNIGDIEFSNYFEIDTFGYFENLRFITKNISSGFLVKNSSNIERKKINIWSTVDELTKQYQQYTFIANGLTKSFSFDIISEDLAKKEANLKVYIDGVLQNNTKYSVVLTDKTEIVFPKELTENTKLDILVNSKTNDTAAFYQIPSNLEINPLNKDFQYLTLGQIRNHAREVFSNLNDLQGIELGSNNSKDLPYTNVSGTILQHASPAIYANLFLCHDRANFVEAIYFAQREYTKFKNRFLEHAGKLTITSDQQVPLAVDQIMSQITSSKNVDSPWYYSDMVPHGTDNNKFSYKVLDVDIKTFNIENIFNDKENSSRAVLVYHNNKQLIKGIHYNFSETLPAVILADDFTLTLDDVIDIVDYNNTDGNYIPETPSKLGLYPKYDPKIYLDDRYALPQLVIQGHDGSITPAFGDYRDQMLLELELRIFNNIKIEFDNGGRSILHNVRPGKFRNNLYSLSEFDRVLTKSFLRWLGYNQVDYINNTTYKNSDSRTWNYSRSGTIFNELMPGHWRGIFRYLYDTDRPNTHPWEMLGFSIKPAWWENYYGPAPYTGGNLTLWQDLENGIIRDGERKGTDSRFSRPGLTSFIPVNEFGEIKSPDDFLIVGLSSGSTSASWAIGDHGPVETTWRQSSNYPFAMQIALALTRPAEYFGLMIDNHRYKYDAELDQLLIINTKDRIRPEQIYTQGLDSLGKINRVTGYTNYIVDYLTSQGINGAVYVKNLIENINVKLTYKIAGFADKKNIKLFVEQSSPGSTNDSILIPQENYQLYFHKSSPNRRAVYSAVIIRKTATGYAVEGYDYNNPYFVIVPSRTSNNFVTVKGINTTAKVYQDYQSVYLTIPYGFEFTNRQQVVDFLISYQRYLIGVGFTFNEFDEILKSPRDWQLSSTEFLVWSEQGWGENTVIVLNPCLDKLTLVDNTSTVDEINGKWTGSRVLDQNFSGINPIDFHVIRDVDEFQIETLNQKTIGLADLAVVQYEHVLIVDNETVFSDVIYSPELGNRQLRLKVNGIKTGSWSGKLNAPGFMYNKGTIDEWQSNKDYFKGDLVKFKNKIYSAIGFVAAAESFEFENWSLKTNVSEDPSLLINFASNARKFLNIYDVDADYYDLNLEAYSNNLIGFKNRSYLEDFSLDTKTQVKLYQGFIKEKGTKKAVDALINTKFNKLTGDIDFSEEWAVRMGTYGAVDNQRIVELVLNEKYDTGNPFGVELIENKQTPTPKFKSYKAGDVYDAPLNFDLNLFANRNTKNSRYDQDLTNAGFLTVDEADAVVFDIASSTEQLNSLIDIIGVGFKIWTAKDYESKWNLYTTVPNQNRVTNISFGLDLTCQVTTEFEHNFIVGNLIIIKDFDDQLNGVYRINQIDSEISFTVSINLQQADYLSEVVDLVGSGTIYTLQSLKFNKLTDLANRSIKNNSKVYIDDQVKWQVYEKTQPWNWTKNINSRVTGNSWGSSISISGNQNIISIGNPTQTESLVEYFDVSNINVPYYKTLLPLIQNSSQFGMSLDNSGNRLFVGSKSTSRNYIAVYDYFSNRYNIDQFIVGPAGHSEYGYSVSGSSDGTWLAVGSPSQNNVFIYKLVVAPSELDEFVTTIGQINYTLSFTPIDINAVRVYRVDDQVHLLPGIDFTINGTLLTLTSPPVDEDNYIITTRNYYKLQATITPSDVNAGDRFGEGVNLNDKGRQLIVTAPNKSSDRGAVYIFDRTVEAFISTIGQNTIVTRRNLVDTFYEVRVNGDPQFVIDDFIKTPVTPPANPDRSITFNKSLAKDSLVEVETNEWLLLQKVESILEQTNSNFGKAFDYCNTSCSLFVGQPNYFTSSYKKGIVLQYPNVPLSSGQIVSNPISHRVESVVLGSPILGTVNSATAVVTFSPPQLIGGVTAQGTVVLNGDGDIVGITVTNKGSGYTATPTITVVDTVDNETKVLQNGLNDVTINLNVVDLVANDSIRINDQEIIFTGSIIDINKVVSTIANKIGGIDAYRVNDSGEISSTGTRIKIINNDEITLSELMILPGSSSTTVPTHQKIGLNVFQHKQTLYKPETFDNESFGTKVSISKDSAKLLVSAEKGFMDIPLVIDPNSPTTFDIDSTYFFQKVINTGVVYEFETLVNRDKTSTIAYIQKIIPNTLETNDNFGFNTILSTNRLIVLSKKTNQVGRLSFFSNEYALNGYNLVREQDPIVDLESIGTLYLYNKRTDSIITYLDNVDPQRGKILGAADQEIDYKTTFDPAVYNVVNGIDAEIPQYHWSSEHVGRVWWNLDTVRYIEYQQESTQYRFDNWGRIFPGSSIDIYEWVESTVLPSEYLARGFDGVPKHPDDSAYSMIQKYDPQSGSVKTKYYFWVTNKITEIANRNISVVGIQSLILNPNQQGIPYAAVLSNRSLSLYNCTQFLSGDDVVLKVIGNQLGKELPVHNEWHLIKQNDTDSIPEFIVSKMFDSIIGQIDIKTDSGTIVKPVPDPLLPKNKRYGVSVRPRQGMFVSRTEAAKVFVRYLNQELAKNILVGRKNLDRLSVSDPVPDASNYDYEFDTYEELEEVNLNYVPDGSRFLIRRDRNRNLNWSIYSYSSVTKVLTLVRTQKYNVSNFWIYKNWYEEGFDPRTIPDFIVSDFSQAPKTGIKTGQLLKVNNTGSGQWGIYRKTDVGYDPMALESATIELSSLIYEPEASGIGYESINFDDGFYDYNPSTDLRILLNTVKEDIIIDDLKYIFNRSIFVMFEYVIYEQNQPDWLFKTSFISILHRLRQLVAYPNYVLDNQDYYKSYIEEIKPYKTKIREYLLSYNGTDTSELDVTDFDYPVFFDQTINRYRYPVAGVDDNIINSSPWVYWKNNSNYSIDRVTVLQSGDNYLNIPTLIVEGGDGTARLTPIMFGGKIVSVRIDNPGNGFLKNPVITIYPIPNSDGSIGSGAVLQAQISNKKVRTLTTKMKFDRIEYTGEVSALKDKTYAVNEFLRLNNQNYIVLNSFTQNGPTLPVLPTTTFVETSLAPNSSIDTREFFDEFIDIRVADNTAFPDFGYIKIDNEIFYYSSKTVDTVVVDNVPTTRYIFRGIQRGLFSTTIATHAPGALVTRLDYKLATASDYNSAMKRVNYHYHPTNGMLDKDLKDLFVGVDYPGVKVRGQKFFRTKLPNLTLTIVHSGNINVNVGIDQPVELTQNITIKWNENNYIKGVITNYNQNTGVATIRVVSSVGVGTFTGIWTLEKDEITEFDVEFEGEPTPELNNLDVYYKSKFLDTSLGIRPDDINVSGGKFVDTYNSHAPEELIPGRIYDTLEIRVFNKLSDGSILGWRQFHNMNSNEIDANLNPSGIVQIIDELPVNGTSFGVKLFDDTPLVIPVEFAARVTSSDNQNRFVCTESTLYFTVNQEIKFSGQTFGGVTAGVSYYVKEIIGNKFTVSETIVNGVAGPIKTLSVYGGTPNFYMTAAVAGARMTGPIVHYPEIMINGELMRYTRYDVETGTISGLIRGLNGPAKTHPADSFVTVRNNLSGTRSYQRISALHTTTLTAPLLVTDKEIKLANVTTFPLPLARENKPGVLFINGEKIHYWTINYETKVIGQIIRGVDGTGIPAVHAAGTRVTDGGVNQAIENSDRKTWIPFAKANANFAGTEMVVTGNVSGNFAVGQKIFGPGIIDDTEITGFIISPSTLNGKEGTYYISKNYNTPLNGVVITAGGSFESVTTAQSGFLKQQLSYEV